MREDTTKGAWISLHRAFHSSREGIQMTSPPIKISTQHIAYIMALPL